jgi:hypothetical protein
MTEAVRRPKRVTLLAWALLGLSAWNALRLLQALRFWSVLSEYRARPAPLYLALTGGVWMAAGGMLAAACLRGKVWAWPGACGFVLAYGLWYWLDRLLAQGPRPGVPLALALTLILLGLAALVLLSGRTRRFFGTGRHDR